MGEVFALNEIFEGIKKKQNGFRTCFYPNVSGSEWIT